MGKPLKKSEMHTGYKTDHKEAIHMALVWLEDCLNMLKDMEAMEKDDFEHLVELKNKAVVVVDEMHEEIELSHRNIDRWSSIAVQLSQGKTPNQIEELVKMRNHFDGKKEEVKSHLTLVM